MPNFFCNANSNSVYRKQAVLLAGFAACLATASGAIAAPTYYTVTTVESTTQSVDGQVLADPNRDSYDGLLFSKSAIDYQEFRLNRDVSWYTPAAGFNKKYQHIRVEGSNRDLDVLDVFSLEAKGTDCFFYDFKIRSLQISNAQLNVSDNESGTPPTTTCIRPVDLFVSSNSGAITSEIQLENGILDLNGRRLHVEGVPMNLTAASGTNTIRAPGNESFAGNPLQVDVAPAATLQIVPLSGLTRFSAAPNINVDNSTLEVFSEVADGNLVWGLQGRSNQDFVIENNGALHVGDGATSFRFGLEFAAGEGLQVDGGSVSIASFGTLSSALILNDGEVHVAANGHLVTENVRSTGNSLLLAQADALETGVGGLEVDTGTLVVSGGRLKFNGAVPGQVAGTLQLGRPGDPVPPHLGFTDTSPRNPLTPFPELFFDSGSLVSGSATVDMNAPNHALFFANGSMLSPGHSVGFLRMNGHLFMEDGATFRVEIDLGAVSSGLAESDIVELTAPYGFLSLGLGNGTLLDVTLLNDTALPAGTKARLITYPDAADWNGATFSGLPNGHVFELGMNWWQINYDEPLVPGLEGIVPVRTVTLTVVEPRLTVSPTVLNFGSYLVGNPSSEQFVTLQNTGIAPLEIATVAASNTDYALQTDGCSSQTLNGGQSCQVGFVFTPTVVGVDISDLVINGQISGALVGEGIPGVSNGVSLAPTFVDFGDVDINTLAGPTNIVLENLSGVALSPLTISIVGSAQFSQVNDCGNSLADSGNCTIEISFSPTAEGFDGAVLRVFDNGVKVAEAALVGTGITEPLVTLNPNALAFGDQAIGVPSAPMQFLIENSGSANLEVSHLSVSSPDYAISTDNCTGVTVSPAGDCAVEVVFTPSTPGSDPAGISVLSNAASSPDTLDLSGNGLGPTLSLDRSVIDFGSQVVGVPSTPQAVMVTNNGNAPLDIATVSSSSAEFVTDGGDCVGASLSAGESCSFAVVLTGDSVHTSTGVITIVSNAASSPDSVQVTGEIEGVQPAQFRVTKNYPDGEDEPVEVQLVCNGGHKLVQEFTISPDRSVTFQLRDFSPGETRCNVTEPEPPEGYRPVYDNGITSSPDSCEYLTLESGGQYVCHVSNRAAPAILTVTKHWSISGTDEGLLVEDALINIVCDRDILAIDDLALQPPSTTTQLILGDGESSKLAIDVSVGTAHCTATEVLLTSVVESESTGCTHVELKIGADKECLFVNTVFFEGIPSLDRAGQVALLLLLLGMGWWQLRRQL